MMSGSETRVALLCIDPWPNKDGGFQPFNYSVRKVQAAVTANPSLHAVVEVFDSGSKEVEPFVELVEQMDPDVVGVSAYVWSFPTFVEVARRLKANRPDRAVIFGGPSARMEMFALEPFRDGPEFVDALVLGEGEDVFQEILALKDRSRDALRSIGGIAVSTGDGWHVTAEHALPILDTLASPFQMNLVPAAKTAHLETFRGCPLSCTFCQWGDLSKASRVFSVEYLIRELSSYQSLGLQSAMIVDAALNLNARAFRNLRIAEREVGFFRTAQINCEIYPQHLTDDHLEFLSEVGGGVNLGLGLQSYSKGVLDNVERPFDEKRFEKVVADLLPIAPRAALEIIMGLPGDDPDSFRYTLHRAMGLGASVRVFRCLVLPNALMSRAPASFDMVYDPITLSMISCLGWSAEALDAMSAELDDMAAKIPGAWLHNDGRGWYFPSRLEMQERFGDAEMSGRSPISIDESRGVGQAAMPAGTESASRPVAAALRGALSDGVAIATGGVWSLATVEQSEDHLTIAVTTPSGELSIDARPAREGARSFRVRDGVAYSYQRLATDLDGASLERLEFLIEQVRHLVAIAIEPAASAGAAAVEELPTVG
jgi:radical SAM superfamily enzyme YgiQ (UPF0313 family)